MAVFSSGTGLRGRGFIGLSLVAAFAAVALGGLLWQAVELSSLAAVSARVDQAKPILSGLKLALIGLLAFLWPWIPSLWLRADADDEDARVRWMALRWRVIGWLLLVELTVENQFGRLVSAVVHP